MTDIQMLTYFIRTFVNFLEEDPSHLMLDPLGCHTCSVTNTHILLVVLSSLTPRFPGIQVIHTTQNSVLEYSSYLGSSLGQNYKWLHHFCLSCEVYPWCMGRTRTFHSCHQEWVTFQTVLCSLSLPCCHQLTARAPHLDQQIHLSFFFFFFSFLEGLNRILFSYSSRGWKSGVRVQA